MKMVLKKKNNFLKKNLLLKVSNLKKKTSRLNKRYLIILLSLLILIIIFYFAKSFFIAALVNGKPISRISLISTLERQNGQQALDNLITEELITQEAKKKGIAVTDQNIQDEIKRIRDVVEEQGTSLETALAYQGQTIDDLQDTLFLKLNVEKILGGEIEVTNDEISKYFDENKTLFGTKKLDEVKEQIKEQLFQEKLGTKFQEWIAEVKNNANIKYFVNY